MNYSYEFIKVEPKRFFVQIKFSTEGKPDIWKNLIARDFSEDGLNILAQSQVPSVVVQWDNYDSAPEAVELTNPMVSATYKPKTVLPQPEFEDLTQKLEEVITETETEIIHSWNVVDKTESEKAEALGQWRATKRVSMRQARLALIQQGLLGQVNAAIAQMQEPDKSIVETEWEYASTVERSSPWIASMQGALGLTDEQMDDLFKLAETL